MKHRCDEFRVLVGDYSDLSALTLEEKAKFDEHLAECGDCLASLKGMVVQRSVLRTVFRDSNGEQPLAEDLVARCVAAMKRAAREGERGAGEKRA